MNDPFLTVGKLKAMMENLPDDMRITITSRSGYTDFINSEPLVKLFAGVCDESVINEDDMSYLIAEWVEDDGSDEYVEEYLAAYKKVLNFDSTY